MSSRKATLSALCLLFTFCIGSQAAWGATVYADANAPGLVRDGLSWCTAWNTLDEALDAADAGSTILVAGGTYKPRTTGLANPREATFQLLNGVAIEGGYAGCGASDPDERNVILHKTILSGDLNGDDTTGFVNVSDNVFHVVTASFTDATAVLDGVTISGGNANAFGGGMFNQGGTPTISNCEFRRNRAASQGGGMFNVDGGDATLLSCTFIGNRAPDAGGAMYNSQSAPTLLSCVFTANSAVVYGGAVCNRDGSNARFERCRFTQNTAAEVDGGVGGGGAMVNARSNPTLIGCTFTSNQAPFGKGGALVNQPGFDPTLGGSLPTIERCRFENNVALYGGGMYDSGSAPIVTETRFTGNIARVSGGGVFIIRAGPRRMPTVPLFTKCTFTSNSTEKPFTAGETFSGGGGVYNTGSSLRGLGPRFVDCEFVKNASAHLGGGLLGSGGDNIDLLNCLIRNNTARSGGGMANYHGVPTLTGTVFTGNVGMGDAGAIFSAGITALTLINCTISGNHGQSTGGLFHVGGTATLVNTIVWGNRNHNGQTKETVQLRTSLGTIVVNHSIIDGWTGALGGVGNHGNDPLFVDFDGPDNIVGTEDDDLRLRAGSPAIDAGDNGAVTVTTDFQHEPRLMDDPNIPDTGIGAAPIVDMGAFEFGSHGVPIPAVSTIGLLLMAVLMLAAGGAIMRRSATRQTEP